MMATMKLDPKTGMYECDDLSAWAEEHHGIKPVSGLTLGQMADKIIAGAARAEADRLSAQNRVEDALVDAHNNGVEIGPRRRFMTTVDRRTEARSPRLIDMYDRKYAVEPGFGWAMANDLPYAWGRFETDSYDEAIRCAQSYLFCGAPWAVVRSYNEARTTETFEHWRAL